MENENGKKSRKAALVTEKLIVETIYDRESKTTKFAVFQDGEVKFLDQVEVGAETYYPIDGRNDLLTKNVVLLPSSATDYLDDQTLLLEVQGFIHKYLDISPMFERIASYYVLCSWLYDRFYEIPYLRAIGDFGSGKSRFLQTIGSICYRPIFTGGATTPSPIFRILNEIKGTLILDEADFKSSEMSDDIVKILNSGYQRGSAVLRSEGKGVFEVKAYDVYSPKVIATRETFNDKALESRFLVEQMGSMSLRKDIPRRLSDEFYAESCEIRNKLLMWRFKNFRKELNFDENEIEGVSPRLHQIIIPLLTIIDDEEMKASLKDFVQKYNVELVADRGQSWESDIILAILKLSSDFTVSELGIKEITRTVNEEAFEEDKITPKKVGWYLRSRLQMKPERKRDGFVLSVKKYHEKLLFWKERYGIADTDITSEDVNVVNNVNVAVEEDSDPILF